MDGCRITGLPGTVFSPRLNRSFSVITRSESLLHLKKKTEKKRKMFEVIEGRTF